MERLIALTASCYHDRFCRYVRALDEVAGAIILLPSKYVTGQTEAFLNLQPHTSHRFVYPRTGEEYYVASVPSFRSYTITRQAQQQRGFYSTSEFLYVEDGQFRVDREALRPRPEPPPVDYGPLEKVFRLLNRYMPSVYNSVKIFGDDESVRTTEISRTRNSEVCRYERTTEEILRAYMDSLDLRCDDCQRHLTDPLIVTAQRRSYGLFCPPCKAKNECPYCGRRHGDQSRCQRCKFCKACCQCRRCPCGTKHKIYRRTVRCNRCDKCAIHKCECRFPRQLPTDDLKRLQADVAFEFEFGTNEYGDPPSSSTVQDAFHRVTTMTDTSCSAGFEALSGPLPLNKAVDLTRDMVDWCNSHEYTRVSDSTSYHVHVNAVDLSLLQLRKVFITWCTFEDDIYREFIADHRRHNRYAELMTNYAELPEFLKLLRRAKTPQEIRKLMLLFMYTSQTPKQMEYLVFQATKKQKFKDADPLFKSLKYYSREKYATGRNITRPGLGSSHISARYTTLNLHSFFYRGTLEFRGKEINFIQGNLEHWLKFCYRFVRVVANLPENEHIKSFEQLMELTNKQEKK